MKRTVPGEVASGGEHARRADEHRDVRVVTARVHASRRSRSRTRAPVSSGIGSASMSARSRIVGPGSAAVQVGDHRRRRRRRCGRRGRARRARRGPRLRARQVEAELGLASGCGAGARPRRAARDVREQLVGRCVHRAEPYAPARNQSRTAGPNACLVLAVRRPQRVARPRRRARALGGSSGSARRCASTAAPATNASARSASSARPARPLARVEHTVQHVARARPTARGRTARPRAHARRCVGPRPTTRTARRRRSTLASGAGRARQVVGPRPHAVAQLGEAQPPHRVAQRGPVGRRRAPSPGPRPAATLRSTRPAPGRGSSPALAAGLGPARRARRRRRAPCSSPRSTMRLSATRAVPSATPNRPHHCTRRAPAHAGRVHAEQQARDHRAGRERPVQQRLAYYVLVAICRESVISARGPADASDPARHDGPRARAPRRLPPHRPPDRRTPGPRPRSAKQLRRIPNLRNALSVASCSTRRRSGSSWLAVWLDNPFVWIAAFLLMGRAHAQFAALMHEAAHRLLFRNRKVNDWVGRWLLGYPVVHADRPLPPRPHGAPPRRVRPRRARHPALPRLPDLQGLVPPQARARRDRADRLEAASRACSARCASPSRRSASRPGASSRVQLVLIAIGDRARPPVGVLSPLVRCRTSRCGASSTGCARSPSTAACSGRRTGAQTTHTVQQHLGCPVLARAVPHRLAPRPPRRLRRPDEEPPGFHAELERAGYVTDALEYPRYPALWRKLASG